MNCYLVIAKLRHASCYNSGYEYEICAPNKAQAISSARKRVRDDGHCPRTDGALIWSAERRD